MPDSITPVGAMIQPPNPQQGLNTMSSILGIRQQQQNLQTGQINQATVQAESTQQQQKTAELQAVGNLTKNAGTYKKADGTFDNQKFSDDVNVVAPVWGPTIANQATSKAGMIFDNQQKLLSLSSDRRQVLADTYGSLAADPTADHAKYVKAMQDIVKQYPNDTAMSDLAISSMGSMPNQEGQPLQQWARNAAIAAKSPTATQTNPSVGTYQGAKGIQAFQNNPQAVGGVQNIGNALGPQGVAPQMTAPPGGIPTPYVPGAGVGSPGKGPNASGPTPTDQDMARQNDYETKLNNRVQIGTDAQSVIRETESAVNAIRNGAGSSTRASIAKTLQAVGAPQGLVDAVSGGNLGATQEAEKMLFQQTLMGLRQSMQGDPAHVTEFNEANAVFPNIDTDPRAKQKIMNFISNKADRDYAEQQSLNSAKKGGTFNPATWQADYQQQLRAGKVSGTPESQIPKSVKTVTRTGTLNGRKVAEYSDGTHAYVQ